jgi:hypothetical protein
MLQRCTNPKNPSFERYGGRGITVCERWRDFAAFQADMGEPPAGLTLDRKDNDLGYQPENCRWATDAEQTRNTRRNRRLTLDGRTQCMSDWARELGIRQQLISRRLSDGWPVERALAKDDGRRTRWELAK